MVHLYLVSVSLCVCVCAFSLLSPPARKTLNIWRGTQVRCDKSLRGDRVRERDRTQGVLVCVHKLQSEASVCVRVGVGEDGFVVRYGYRYRDTQEEGKRRGGAKERHLAMSALLEPSW